MQQIEFIGQLNQINVNGNATNIDTDQYKSVLTILENLKETRLTFSQGIATVL